MRRSCNRARIVALTAFSSLVTLSLVSPLFAHGGKYPGPSDTIPPNTGGGGDGTPGGNPGGPGTPGPAGPTQGGSRGGPSTGGAPPTEPGARRKGSGVVASRNGKSGSYDQWEFWWENNDDPFLALKTRMRNGVITSQGLGAIGSARRGEDLRGRRPTSSDVTDTIVPALLSVVDSKEADLADSAVLALARIVPSERAATVLPAFRQALRHDEKSVRESATLAFGVLGAPEARAELHDLLLDTPQGRAATNHPTGVETQVRAFAAASLGMIGSRESVEDLKRIVRDGKLAAPDDLKAIALLALGMIREGHEQTVPFLQEAIADRGLPALVRAQAPIAIARMADQDAGRPSARAAMHSLLARFLDEKVLEVRRSLAIALGRIADPADAEVLDALIEAAQEATDTTTRDFSLMALAEIGARDGDVVRNAAAHRRLEKVFSTALTQPTHVSDKPYGALALGIWGRNPGLERATVDDARKLLANQLDRENNPSFKGALSIALGLLSANEYAEEITKQFEDSRDASFRGYAAVGLGLMLARNQSEMISEAIGVRGIEAKCRLQFARALGLLGEPKAIERLLQQFREATTLAETSATVEALGLIGDRSAMDPLVQVVRDASATPLQRGFASIALGLLAEKTDLPWYVLFTVDSNYRAKTPALAEIFEIL